MSESESKPTKDFIILDKQAWNDIKRYVVGLKGSIDQQAAIEEYELLLRVINDVDMEWPQWQ